ncbi:MAG: hypothetical protein JW827_10150 [Spirochaetes bacterium]|nr:hypothetical protein [Spirochaetota bacterium]
MKHCFFLFCFLFVFIYQSYGQSFKKKGFDYPVLTFNTEIGERYAFNPFEDLSEEDYQTIDSYNYTQGYIKIMQQLNLRSKCDLTYSFKKKDYDLTDDLDNNHNGVTFNMVYRILEKITGRVGMKYKDIDYSVSNEKDGKQISPEMEIKYRPIEEMLLGLKYVYLNMSFNGSESDSFGNRVLLYWQERFLDSRLRMRVRYRGENRDYQYPSSTRKSSFKHALSATASIDFN